MTDTVPLEELTRSQAERRGRVITAALELGAEGGYDAVQMRDVSQRADVALGTIYRYFSSKDHLLAAAQIEWSLALEQEVGKRPLRAGRIADRMAEILRRASRILEYEPKLAAALVSALASSDRSVGICQQELAEVMTRIQSRAFPPEFDAEKQGRIIRTIELVWFSVLISWVNGWMSITEVRDELTVAAHLLLDQYG